MGPVIDAGGPRNSAVEAPDVRWFSEMHLIISLGQRDRVKRLAVAFPTALDTHVSVARTSEARKQLVYEARHIHFFRISLILSTIDWPL